MERLTKMLKPKRIYDSRLPEDLLRTDYKRLELTDLRRLLCKLILTEKNSRRVKARQNLMRYAIRLRERRLRVAEYFVSQGGKVSHLLLLSRLPPDIKWPGLIALVETKDFESELIP